MHFSQLGCRFLKGDSHAPLMMFSLMATWFLAFSLLLFGLALMLSSHAVGAEMTSVTDADKRHKSKLMQNMKICQVLAFITVLLHILQNATALDS